jgi:SLOG family YspA-like protein
MRVLVTGSRDWIDRSAIERALKDFGPEGWFTVVHGHCPTGADAIADHVARSWGCEVERHPADWSKGRKAGPARNAAMVALGADLCLAFIGPCTSPRCNRPEPHDSHGATGCADLAEAAGIPTRRIRECRCGCPADMHIGEIGCPCGLPDEPPCAEPS